MNVEYDEFKNEIKALKEKLNDSEKKRIVLENLVQMEMDRCTGMAESCLLYTSTNRICSIVFILIILKQYLKLTIWSSNSDILVLTTTSNI